MTPLVPKTISLRVEWNLECLLKNEIRLLGRYKLTCKKPVCAFKTIILINCVCTGGHGAYNYIMLILLQN